MRRALAALQASLLEAAACSSASVSGRGSAAAASGAAAWRSGAAAPPAALRWASSAAAPQADSEGPSASTSASASGSRSSSEPAAGAGPSSSGSGGGGGGGLTPEQQRSLLSGKRFYKTVRVEAAPQVRGLLHLDMHWLQYATGHPLLLAAAVLGVVMTPLYSAACWQLAAFAIKLTLTRQPPPFLSPRAAAGSCCWTHTLCARRRATSLPRRATRSPWRSQQSGSGWCVCTPQKLHASSNFAPSPRLPQLPALPATRLQHNTFSHAHPCSPTASPSSMRCR